MTLDDPVAGVRGRERRLPGPPGVLDPERRLPGPPTGRVAQPGGIGAALSTARVRVGRGRDAPRVWAG
jgi:hypothetical protein